jgi:hypothetical protein
MDKKQCLITEKNTLREHGIIMTPFRGPLCKLHPPVWVILY